MEEIRLKTAVIVLANLMDADGRLNHESAMRLRRAAAVVRENPETVLVTTGWKYRDDTDLAIADAVADAAIQFHQIDSNRIIRLRDARDTVGDAVFFSRNITADSVIVVTSGYHKKRAAQIFRFVLGENAELEVIGTGEPATPAQEKSEAASLRAFSETFTGIRSGDTQAILARLFERHPFYNGTIDARTVRLHD